MKNLNTYIIVILALALASCSTDHVTPDGKLERQVFVDVGGAILPVMIAGKNTSDVCIVFVHGGPGNSGQLFRKFKGMNDIEDHYKVIYYDQRASGMTQGNSSEDELTIEQFSEDLDVIVDFAKEVVGAKTIYVLGHSWGGGLSTYYMLDPAHQAKTRGFIAVAPAFNVVQAMENSRNWIINVANTLVALNIRKNYWQGALDYYAAHPVIQQDDFIDHSDYLNEADGVNFSDRQEVDVDLPDFMVQAFAQNFLYAQAGMTIGGSPIFDAMELNSQMSSITLPTLLLWGEKDGLLPINQAADFEASIGTHVDSFFFHSFPVSAHEPMAEEPVDFTNLVRAFVELTR
ncbi:MAG: alpha/beta hydrolase [Bacteroidetes bacterium]|nr:alpha/beta hydrolase [Bacteroidota bacterium]